MFHDKRERTFHQGKKKNIGFYIALAICVVTVAGAAWTTYGSVMNTNSNTAESSQQEELAAGNDVSGESYRQAEPKTNSSKDENEEENSPPQESSTEESTSSSDQDSAQKVNTETEEPALCPPVENIKILKPYSPKDPLYSKTTADWRTHQGVDIRAEEGCAVHSATDGVVKSIGKSDMFGNVVRIAYDGYEISYCGMSEKPIVSEGNHVKAGDTIGYAGIVPGELLDESHIHIEVKEDGQLIDPAMLKSDK